MRRLLVFLPLALGVLAAMLWWQISGAPGHPPEQGAAAQAAPSTATDAIAAQRHIWSAAVEYKKGVAHIVARHKAYISELRVEVGDTVEDGDPLAVLFDDDFTYPPPMITATSDGVVVARHVSLGDTVGKETLAFEVANKGGLWLRVEVPQDNAHAPRVGMALAVQMQGGKQQLGTATIVRLAPALDSARLDRDSATPVRAVWAALGEGTWLAGQQLEVVAAAEGSSR